MRAIYEAVTNQIVADLEAGTIPWTQPWKNQHRGGIMPINGSTGRPYSGINIPILWHAARANGYPSHEWMTFKQAIEKKACVKKGSKGTVVVFTKRIVREDEDDRATISMLKTYYVFNMDQIEGLPDDIRDAPKTVVEPVEAAERFIAATKADIRLGGSKACYVPSHDFVALPPREAFIKAASFYATAAHELGHWSGHETRLDRVLTNRFGSKAYAAEELIAELTAAYLCAHLGIEGELRHADYIATWIVLLKEDNRAIFTAASKASQAANYLRSFSEDTTEED